MSLKQRALRVAVKTRVGAQVVGNRRYRTIFFSVLSLSFNLAYALYHGILGLLGQSWWFTALWAYYIILGMTRFSAVLCERKNRAVPSLETEYFVLRVSGVLLVVLSWVLAGINYMSLAENIAAQYGEITMITIATYTFAKLAMAVLRVIRHRRNPSPLLAAIRRIGYAEAAVSVVTLQRSMLVSFGEMAVDKIRLFNTLTGTGVFLFVSVLGIWMIKESRGNQNGKVKTGQGK